MKYLIKKQMSFTLALILFLSSFQGIQIFGAVASTKAAFDFGVLRQMLKEDSTGLSISERDDTGAESALIKWDASTAAEYKLEYYIEVQEGTQTVTKKVAIGVINKDKTEIALEIAISTPGQPNDEIVYVERIFNNSNFTWGYDTNSKTVPQIEKTLYMGSKQSRDKQEFNIELTSIKMKLDGNKSDNLKLRVKLIGNEIYLYTNGIVKGNITPFSLYYEQTTTGTTEAIAKGELFNGPKDYEITPTHLYLDKDGKLQSLDYIKDIKVVKAGSVPGIKVSFGQVKVINQENFTYVDDLASDTNITLQLGTRYTLGDMTNNIRLDFVPKDGAGVKIDLKEVDAYKQNVVQVKDGQVCLYLSQSEALSKLEFDKDMNPTITEENVVSADPKVIEWDVLDPSTIIDGSFQYGNQAEKYWPGNKGYTYLSYTLNKTSSNQVQINIQPYNIKSRATYSVYILNNKETDRTTPSVVYEYDPNKTETTNITAIVPAGSPSYFEIVVSIDKNTFVSQMVYYDPSLYPAAPEVTQIKSIDNVYVVPSENAGEQGAHPEAIGFDIEWLAPKNVAQQLKNGRFYYELLLRKDPKDYDPITNISSSTSDIFATYSKIFEVALDEKGKVVVNAVAGTAGGDYNESPELRYNESNNSFTMENVALMNFGAPNGNWEKLNIQENHLNANSGEYLKSIEDTEKDNLENRPVPGTYYLSFRTVFIADEEDTPIVHSEESNMVAISLNETNEIIPVPGNITGEDLTDTDKVVISEKISVQNVDIRNYVKKMLEPAGLTLFTEENGKTGRYSGAYEIYLYQKADQLASTVSDVEKGKITPVELTKQNNKLNLNGTEKYIEQLREGGVLPIVLSAEALTGEGSESFEILELDPNEVYYVQIRVKLSPQREGEVVKPRYSLFSKEYTFTTTTTPLPPNPEDKIPPTPEKIWIVDQPNNASATIGWAPADFEEDEDIIKTYYEFIRTELQLKESEKSKTVEELVSEDKSRVGFRSDSPTESNPFMSTYLSKTGKWMNLAPEQVASKFQLLDDTLKPNTVYYYYVRTVCMIEGKSMKSSWIMVPVTTAPVLSPINLKVESSKDYSYDTTDEVVISFDAPVPSESLVPGEYSFDIAVKGELDEAYTTDTYSVTKLTSKQDSSLTPDGYTHFVYKIKDLKPNKRYYIKVRVVDKTKPLTDGSSYPTSLYCDPVTTRTEFDEEEDEKDNKYEEYLKKYDTEAEKLRRKPYWTVEADSQYKYRESYINTELSLQSTYELVGGENTNSLYYYMPASLFTKEKASNTVLQVSIGAYSASIRPFTLTEETAEIEEAIDLISDNSLKDYYVGITFSLRHSSIKVNNESSVTPQITVDMELVYVKDKDRDVEEKIMSALNQLIADERKAVVKALEKAIYNGTIADDVLDKIIEEALQEVEEDHIKEVEKIMDRTAKKTVLINETEKAILLMAKIDYTAVNGYYQSGSGWIGMTTYAVGNGFAMEGTRLGIYVFTGQQSLANTVPSLAPYQSFIAQYQLTDFFTINSYMIQTAATKEQVYGALARVMGAVRGADYNTYLKNKGIKGITSLGKANAIRQDEAIYLVMQGYEILRKRPIQSITIKNKQSVQNIGAFQSVYRNYVYAAVELKIVSNPDSKVIPSKQMTVEEMVIMLYKMQA